MWMIFCCCCAYNCLIHKMWRFVLFIFMISYRAYKFPVVISTHNRFVIQVIFAIILILVEQTKNKTVCNTAWPTNSTAKVIQLMSSKCLFQHAYALRTYWTFAWLKIFGHFPLLPFMRLLRRRRRQQINTFRAGQTDCYEYLHKFLRSCLFVNSYEQMDFSDYHAVAQNNSHMHRNHFEYIDRCVQIIMVNCGIWWSWLRLLYSYCYRWHVLSGLDSYFFFHQMLAICFFLHFVCHCKWTFKLLFCWATQN